MQPATLPGALEGEELEKWWNEQKVKFEAAESLGIEPGTDEAQQ